VNKESRKQGMKGGDGGDQNVNSGGTGNFQEAADRVWKQNDKLGGGGGKKREVRGRGKKKKKRGEVVQRD